MHLLVMLAALAALLAPTQPAAPAGLYYETHRVDYVAPGWPGAPIPMHQHGDRAAYAIPQANPAYTLASVEMRMKVYMPRLMWRENLSLTTPQNCTVKWYSSHKLLPPGSITSLTGSSWSITPDQAPTFPFDETVPMATFDGTTDGFGPSGYHRAWHSSKELPVTGYFPTSNHHPLAYFQTSNRPALDECCAGMPVYDNVTGPQLFVIYDLVAYQNEQGAGIPPDFTVWSEQSSRLVWIEVRYGYSDGPS